MKAVSSGALLCALFICTTNLLFGQGSLTPPGAPAPTMKSLDQIEARTPISTAPYYIKSSGSYYLTRNLTVSSGDAITIAASGATLDLNGFTISSSASSANGTAISISQNITNIIIRNGSVKSGVTVSGGTFSGSGFVNGVNYSSSLTNARVAGVQVSGVLGQGIYVGGSNSNVVESCTVQIAGGYGIFASVVRDSAATNCGIDGILGDEVLNCDASAVSTGGNGIYANHVAQNCSGTSVSGYGIVGDEVQNCYGQSNSGTGLSGYTVHNCHGVSSSGTALNGVTVINSYANNNSTDATITGTTVLGTYAVQAGSGRCIDAGNVANSAASSQFSGTTNATLILAKNVSNTYAQALNASGVIGIDADVVQNSWATVTGDGSLGIAAQVTGLNCYARVMAGNGNGLLGDQLQNCYAAALLGNAIIGDSMVNCYATAGGGGTGLTGNGSAPNISHCTAWMNGGTGIDVSVDAVVEDCVIVSANTAMIVGTNCLIKGNNFNSNTNGLLVTGSANRIEGNNGSCPANGQSFIINGSHNLLINNSARDNGTNQFSFIGSPNSFGTIVNVSAGGAIGTTDPRANLVY